MNTSKLSKSFLILIVSALMLVAVSPSVYAGSETDELKGQIQALNERIAVLEKQLAQKELVDQGAASQAAPYARGFGSQNYSWDPFREMQMIQQRMNQMFDHSFDQSFGLGSSGFLSPQTDIKSEEGRYVVTLDIPGMDKESINVEVKNGSLIVSGKRSAEKENKGDRFYSQQRSFGQFMKTLALPDDAKADQVEARYDKGVLEVSIGRETKGKVVGSGSKKVIVK